MKAKEKEFLEKLADLMLEYDALLGVKKEFITVDVDYFMDDQQTIYIPFDGVLSYRGIKKIIEENVPERNQATTAGVSACYCQVLSLKP